MPSMPIAAEAPTQPPGLATLAGLAGCWRVQGQVRGSPSPSIARGTWRFGGRYFQLQLRANAGRAYEASITYGAGEKSQEIGSVWHDTFGGLYEPSLGRGSRTADGFVQTYRFPDALYVNRFARAGSGWRWTITEQVPGKPDRPFADYRLARASCRGVRFSY